MTTHEARTSFRARQQMLANQQHRRRLDLFILLSVLGATLLVTAIAAPVLVA